MRVGAVAAGSNLLRSVWVAAILLFSVLALAGCHLRPLLYDVTESSLELRFYPTDGEVDSMAGDPTLIFSKPFRFKLKLDE